MSSGITLGLGESIVLHGQPQIGEFTEQDAGQEGKDTKLTGENQELGEGARTRGMGCLHGRNSSEQD